MGKDLISMFGSRVTRARRHYLKGAALGSLGFCTRWAIGKKGDVPEWTEVVEIDLDIEAAHDRLYGKRIAHISDLHLSRTVSSRYLRRCIERINMLNVDVVVLTGDYITYDFGGKYRKRVVGLLGEIESRFGAYACLGNHDYGVRGRHDHLLDRLTGGMEDSGVTVLRNNSTAVDIDGQPLWLVGLGDLRVGDFRPHKAFADVPRGQATIALIHNPRGVEYLGGFSAHAVMSGHTHGRKARFWPAASGKNWRRRFHAGMYEVGGSKLYVNRGLGRVGRARFSIRPEITVFTLR